MNPMRLALIGVVIAIVAGVAYLFFGGESAPPPAAVEVEVPKIDAAEVLSAARDIPVGTIISDLDLRWSPWPTTATGPAMITKAADPNAIQSLKGSIARVAHMEGEPIRREKLVSSTSGGFISALLPSGMQAVSIPMDGQGTASAGGFILPNDRVDLLRVGHVGDTQQANVIASNVRVLAIGRALQEPVGGDRTMQGPNITLEVTPEQAQDIAVAQLTGSISLALRSLQDGGKPTPMGRDPGLSIIRFGAESQVVRR